MNEEKRSYPEISIDFEKDRIIFYIYLKSIIAKYAKAMQWGGSCDDTVRSVLKEINFSTEGMKSENIDKNIQHLTWLSDANKDITIIKSSPGTSLHRTAQIIANSSAGDYIVIALLANYKYPDEKQGGQHHVGIVIKAKPSNNPMIGQGGLRPDLIDHIFSPANWSFQWGKRNKKGISNRDAMVYVKYSKRA